jgi:hypothetical protein
VKYWTLAALLLLACANTTDAQRVAQLHQRYDADDVATARLTRDYASLQQRKRELVEHHAEAERRWHSARDTFEEGRSLDELSKRELTRAAKDFASAERQYRYATMALVALAAGSAICDTKMTTAKFRRDMASRGLPIDKLEDVDHSFPRSRGGIDHPLNFQVLDRSLNRSLGNDLVAKFMQAPLAVVSGAAVSALGVLGGCN